MRKLKVTSTAVKSPVETKFEEKFFDLNADGTVPQTVSEYVARFAVDCFIAGYSIIDQRIEFVEEVAEN